MKDWFLIGDLCSLVIKYWILKGDFLRKSKERVGVDASSLFTRFGGRSLEHHSSETDDNKADKQM